MKKTAHAKPTRVKKEASFSDLEGKTITRVKRGLGGCSFFCDEEEYEIFASTNFGAMIVRIDTG